MLFIFFWLSFFCILVINATSLWRYFSVFDFLIVFACYTVFVSSEFLLWLFVFISEFAPRGFGQEYGAVWISICVLKTGTNSRLNALCLGLIVLTDRSLSAAGGNGQWLDCFIEGPQHISICSFFHLGQASFSFFFFQGENWIFQLGRR